MTFWYSFVHGYCAVLKGPGRLSSISGGYGEGETPLPFPNRAVKPLSADGTWPARARESRSPPVSSARRTARGRSVRRYGRSALAGAWRWRSRQRGYRRRLGRRLSTMLESACDGGADSVVQEPAGNGRAAILGRRKVAGAVLRGRRRGAALGWRRRATAAAGTRTGCSAALVRGARARHARGVWTTAPISGAGGTAVAQACGNRRRIASEDRTRRVLEEGEGLDERERASQSRRKLGEHGSEHVFYGRRRCGRNRCA
jgi:hypothetical protein